MIPRRHSQSGYADLSTCALAGQSFVLACQGDTAAAWAAADAAIEGAAELGGLTAATGYCTLGIAALAAGDAATAQGAFEAAWQHWSVLPQSAASARAYQAKAALGAGDLAAARRWADEAVPTMTDMFLSDASGPDANDRAFLQALRGAQIRIDDPSRALFGAQWVCGEFRDGYSRPDVVASVSGGNPMLTVLGAIDFVSDSLAFYCPQYASE